MNLRRRIARLRGHLSAAEYEELEIADQLRDMLDRAVAVGALTDDELSAIALTCGSIRHRVAKAHGTAYACELHFDRAARKITEVDLTNGAAAILNRRH